MEIVVTYCINTGIVYDYTFSVHALKAQTYSVQEDSSLKVAIFSTDASNPVEDFYVDLDSLTLTERKVLDTLVVNNGIISGIPKDTLVTWPDEVQTTENEELEFDSNVSGIFRFRFDPIKYKRYFLEVQYNV